MHHLVRQLYLALRDHIMTRSGLQPKGTFWYSKSGKRCDIIESNWLLAQNLSGGFHPALVASWNEHGLGSRVLLISENGSVKTLLAGRYPSIEFVTADLFPELQPSDEGPDVIWDVCMPPPDTLTPESSIQWYAMRCWST